MKTIDSADVVVVGAGIIGVAAAYFLAKKGLDVIVCDTRNIASGASGRCGGMVCHCHGRDLNIEHTMFRLMYSYENTRILRDVQEHETDIDFEYQQVGSLDIAVSEEEFEEVKRLYHIQKKVGDKEIILLDKKETLDCMPTLNADKVVGSKLRPSDGNLAPFKMCHAFAQAGTRYGARYRTYTHVTRIAEEKGRVTGVETDKGFIASKWVINATNAWARLLHKECDAVLPMRVFGCITEPIPHTPKYAWEAIINDDYIYGGFQMKCNALSFGGPAQPYERYRKDQDYLGYYQERLELVDMKKYGGYLTELFPSLKNTKIIRSWGGVMAFAPDGAPLVGPSQEVEGLIHCVSFYGGMANGAVFGRTAAECVYQKETTFPIFPFNPGRFKGQEYQGPEPWDLGVVYGYAAKVRQEQGFQVDFNKVAKINLDKPFAENVKPGIRLWGDWNWESRYGIDAGEGV